MGDKAKEALRQLEGIGPKTAQLLGTMGIHTPADLLRHFPADYEWFTPPVPIRQAVTGSFLTVRARIDTAPLTHGFGKNAIVSFKIRDESGSLRVSYFHAPYIKSSIHKGEEKVFRGRVRDGGSYGLSLDQPEMMEPEAYEALTGSIRPLYSLPKGLSQKRFREAIRQALRSGASWPELLPAHCLEAGMPSGAEALRGIHFPASRSQLEAARSRLVLEEFTAFILRVRLLRQEEGKGENPCPMPVSAPASQPEQLLPFALTGAQQRALKEIEADLMGEKRMNRLLQGDVGSGKTAVALLALLRAVDNGYQGALMAPTEVLAEQHFAKISALLESRKLPVKTVLLTSSVKGTARREALGAIAAGVAGIVIGTHALIQEGVAFHRLGLVITDEQHRFGVRQRSVLAEKGTQPHMLVMSATPIPRTLAIILYGDLDVSVLDERPAGRLPLKNAVVPPSYRENAYRLILREVQKGNRAYIICPLVEEGESLQAENVEDYSRHLQNYFPPEVKVGQLHGRMKAEEKNRTMRAFAAGDVQVLVATTVVEVGVDVPEATVMMIENAERFGLAQLHQLRGRVGRGKDQSYAIFVDGSGKKEKNKRLEVMASTNDGFQIAEEDLRLRGPGDLFGIRQSGDMRFALGDIYQDHALLLKAAELATRILEKDPALQAAEHSALRELVLQYEPEDMGL